MAKGTFVYSAVAPKNAEQKRRVKLRDSGIRYFVILLAILVVFFYEYCFDTPSVFLCLNSGPGRIYPRELLI